MLLRGMLQGTAWIDAARPIVIGIEIKEPKPAIAAAVPFVEPNESFMASFGAQPGPGYYVLSLPPGQPLAMSEGALMALGAAVRKPGEMSVSVDVALGRILKSREGQIRQNLTKVETLPNADKMIEAGLTAENLEKMIDTAIQIQRLSFRVNLDSSQISTLFEVIAENGTPLSQVLAKSNAQTSLGGYAKAHQMNFRSREFNIQGTMGLFFSAFGDIYKEMGIDVKGMQDVLAYFTGEMAGGMSYGPEGIRFELIALMKDAAKSTDFIEKTYLPWVENYSRSIVQTFQKELGQNFGPIWVRTKPSQVSGYRVVGGKFQMPMMPGADPALNRIMNYDVRMTMVGGKFIMAADDRRIGQLIQTAKAMKKAPASGPLMTADIDLGSYLSSLLAMVPDMQELVGTLPKTGRITVTADLENGRGFTRTVIPTRDISTLLAYFSQIETSAKKMKETMKEKAETRAKEDSEKPKAPLKPEEDPAYWIEKGALAATYGADQSAIKYFQKALSLDPKRSDAYFQMGISYGELKRYGEAIDAIEKAIAINPKRGVYYYGRGRVFLLSGDRILALEDFQIAADLGSEDARKYLELTANQEAK